MKIHRIDHIGINVNDLAAAKAFFIEFGLEVHGEWEAEGAWLDEIVGLENVKTSCVALRSPDGQTWLELVQYIHPSDKNGVQQTHSNTLGIRHICFAVDDIDALVDKMKKKGMETFSEIKNYKDIYKMCYVRGPEGIILELAERIN
ncbi:Catechol 2,3-dioxygenase [Cohnella sp. OV330]|uniref:VOC family protein n=1 Tax=Cohnella sp. OV330 TaxID=1855288 RepID=UPI0008EFBC39|nr:VOC family protein [Cohnella sp. OV330]SFB49546.1 Catechol 2,3-dioxygenase [Cohnella sp. OV330]